MQIKPLGRLNVPTPGTPVPLTTDNTMIASKFFFQVSLVSPARPMSASLPWLKPRSPESPGSLAERRRRLFRERSTLKRRTAPIPFVRGRLCDRCRCGRRRPAGHLLDGIDLRGARCQRVGAVGGGLDVCFPDFHLRHFHRRLSLGVEAVLHLFADVERHVLGRRIQLRERLDVVQKYVVERVRKQRATAASTPRNPPACRRRPAFRRAPSPALCSCAHARSRTCPCNCATRVRPRNCVQRILQTSKNFSTSSNSS